MFKRSDNKFCSDSYVDDVKNIWWSVVCNDEQPDAALDTFIYVHAPIKTMRNLKMEAKGMASKSGSPTDWQMYCKLRNHVTKLNKNYK